MLKQLFAGLLAAVRPALDFINLPRLKPGLTTAPEVRRFMGPPTTIWSDNDGTQTWEYPRTPEGIANYMIVIDAGQVLREVRQVLCAENFARVGAGMSRADVRRLLGQPAHEQSYARNGETVWDWKTIDVANTPAFFNVHFDELGRVLRTSTTPVIGQ
jgi:outer membrane protein assembly factor BamE (lipoprotein component of BamABCDE complex)